MEIEYSIADFNNFIEKIKYYKSEISYAANSIRINFYSKDSKRLYSFWIDPPWRITLDSKIITSSYNYPFHGNYEENQEEQEEKDFYKWCSKTDFMKYADIKRITIMNNCDLVIEWGNGAELNNFINDIEDPCYFFYDKVNDKAYDFLFKKILQDDWVSKNK